ncbi:hypothetical protein V2J09_022021 [Rumex salicifolius]
MADSELENPTANIGDEAPSSSSLPLDPNDPLWLHHSERSNYVLSTQLLNDHNYYKWKRAAEVSLKAKTKMAFVTGDAKKPEPSSPTFAQWERCNSMVTSWIFHSVEKDIAESLLFFDTAAEIWTDLKIRFGHPNSSRVFQVQKELFTVSQGNQSISSYYTSFRRLWDEYFVLVDVPNCNKCGATGSMLHLLSNLQVIQFMVGLNDVYNSVRTNILMRKPVPSLGEVYHMVLEDEKHRELHSTSSIGSDSTALNASGAGRSWTSNSRGGRGGRGNSDRRSMFFCDHCKTQGHTIDRCFKLHGYPPSKTDNRSTKPAPPFSGNSDASTSGQVHVSPLSDPAPQLTKDQYEQLMALLGKSDIADSVSKTGMMAGNILSLSANNSSMQWIIDSGATHHITPYASLIIAACPLLKPEYITMPDGSTTEITHTGSVSLSPQIVLHRVLLVPKFAFNLLSVPQLARDLRVRVLFTPSQCFILQDRSLSRLQALGDLCNGLYLTSKTAVAATSSSSHFNNPTPTPAPVSPTEIAPSVISEPSVVEPSQAVVPPRSGRPIRHITPPSYLKDYVCNGAVSTDQFPLLSVEKIDIRILIPFFFLKKKQVNSSTFE